MEKLMKIVITFSLIVIAINSFRCVNYLKTLTELMGASLK